MPGIYVTEEAFEGAWELQVYRSRRVGKPFSCMEYNGNSREREEGRERDRGKVFADRQHGRL